MSAIAILKHPEAIYFVTDGASYTEDGIVTSIGTKVAIDPEIGVAYFTRGPSGSAYIALYTFVDQFASFDHFVEEAPRAVRKMYYDHEDYMRRTGHPDLEFYFFGWSERRQRPEGYLIRCGYGDSACHFDQKIGVRGGIRKKPFQMHIISDFSIAPGIFDRREFLAAEFPLHLKSREMIPEVELLQIMEMWRRKPSSRFPDQPKKITVGGHAELTRVARDGITQKMLARYDDTVGEPIRPSAPLDWKRWRAWAGFHHSLTTPVRKKLRALNDN